MHYSLTALQQVPWWHHDGDPMGWHWGWWLFWLVLAAVVIWAVTRAVGLPRGGAGGPERSPEDAEDILRRRFAEGGLSDDEFQERLRVLRDSESS